MGLKRAKICRDEARYRVKYIDIRGSSRITKMLWSDSQRLPLESTQLLGITPDSVRPRHVRKG